MRKKITYKDIPYDYKIYYKNYRDGKISVAKIADYNHVSCKTVYKYFNIITEHNADQPLNNRRGRKPKTESELQKTFGEYYQKWKKKEMTITDIAFWCGNSRTTVYRYFRLLESSNSKNNGTNAKYKNS
ncbi:MAG: hypothetical protein K2K06_10490 [Oscillospiraceae bacterium]|nr:hypothetical protein [Oscillospiraceae bacterium]